MLGFQKVSDYTTFTAEFAIDAGDIVFHFFKSAETLAKPAKEQQVYWETIFPECLEPTALTYFAVTPESGRLKAQHIKENELKSEDQVLDSWWLRAYGFGHRLDPQAVAFLFLDKLDEVLEKGLAANRI